MPETPNITGGDPSKDDVDKDSKPHPNEHAVSISSEWQAYEKEVSRLRQQVCLNPSQFSVPIDKQFYLQCLQCPLPQQRQNIMPHIQLPIRICIVRSAQLHDEEIPGCSADLNLQSIQHIVEEMNEKYWARANALFHLSAVDEIKVEHMPSRHRAELMCVIYKSNQDPRKGRQHQGQPTNNSRQAGEQ
jgi:hypothetical protein